LAGDDLYRGTVNRNQVKHKKFQKNCVVLYLNQGRVQVEIVGHYDSTYYANRLQQHVRIAV